MYRVTLSAIDSSKEIQTIRQLRIALQLGLLEARNLVEKTDLPFVLLDGVDLATASRIKEVIEAANAQVEITESDLTEPITFYRPDFRQQSLSESDSPILRGLARLFGKRRD